MRRIYFVSPLLYSSYFILTRARFVCRFARRYPHYTTGLFDKCQTDTIAKIKQDVTRHRYGDEAHLDTTVKKLGLVIPGKAYPQLKELREENTDGQLSFSMVFQSLETPYKMWADPARVKKYETFFGPGVSAECVKVDADQRLVAIKLTTGAKKEEVGGGSVEEGVSA